MLALLAVVASGPAAAHAVDHRVARGEATIVTLSAAGEPLADAPYRVYAPEPGAPFAVGRTDRRGVVSFVPDRTGTWRVVVSAADGHGASIRVDVGDPAAAATGPTGAATRSPATLLSGVGYIVGLAGLFVLWKQRR